MNTKYSFDSRRVLELLTALAGEQPLLGNHTELLTFLDHHNDGLGYSQFNELLLALGYDKIAPEFFDFLCTGTANPNADSKLNNASDLEAGVDRFLKLALFAYGNSKYAYKKFSRNPSVLVDLINLLTPIADKRYVNRLTPALPLKDIDPSDRYFLGYIVERDLKEQLTRDPTNEKARENWAKRERIVEIGIRNQTSYLTSDYLDVYVATSMREAHEYLAVAKFAKQLFTHPNLEALNLRYFDPTLAYCADRIDKGLSEALMLKRAKCTLFLAQESDTLGKDSELASTLAQGKPVVAYVPEGNEQYVNELLETLAKTYPDKNLIEIMLDQLRFFGPDLAWKDQRVRNWLNGDVNESELRKFFTTKVREHYDRRAKILMESHPLGIQVHLETGVAVGVLVVRDINICAALIRRIMLGEFQLKVDEVGSTEGSSGASHLVLREELSNSIFRVMTRDKVLTHTFWNFYLREK